MDAHTSAEYNFKVQCDQSWYYCHHFQDLKAQSVNGTKGLERCGRIDMQHKKHCEMETVCIKQEVGNKITVAEHGTLSEDMRGSGCVMSYTILG